MSGRRDNRFAARIDIEHLRFAVAAAEFGSFHKAAEALNVQQSTLSRRIQDIEHATSSTLFRRSSGGVVVSTSGEEFVRMARAVLEQINEFAPSSIARSRKETLRVGFCSNSLKILALQLERRPLAVFWLVGVMPHEAINQAVLGFDCNEPILKAMPEGVNSVLFRRTQSIFE